MANQTADPSLHRTAKLAGWLYLVFAILGIFGYMYISPRTTAGTHAAAIALNLQNNEFLFRIGKAIGLVSNAMFVYLALILYQLFKRVDGHQARLMVGLVLVAVPVAFVAEALEFTALNLFKGKIPTSFPTEQVQDLAMIFVKTAAYFGQLVTLFWGLWLFPLGILVYKSIFLPRFLGILLCINGLGYVVQSFTFVLFPEHLKTVLTFIFPIYFSGEIPFLLWILIKGAGGKSE